MNTSRRKFIRSSGLASLALVHHGAASPSIGKGNPQTLDALYQRVDAPMLKLHYPEDWYLSDGGLLTDLISPIQLFAVSNRFVKPHSSSQGSGRLNVEELPADATIIWARAQPYSDQLPRDRGRDLALGIDLMDFSRVVDPAYPNFEILRGWYSGVYLYDIVAFVSKSAGDTQTARDILAKLTLD